MRDRLVTKGVWHGWRRLAASALQTVIGIRSSERSHPLTIVKTARLNRRQIVVTALSDAEKDEKFWANVIRADVARDSANWQDALHAYSEALLMHPLHAGYLVQRGHCLKELHLFEDAELAYRDALALGAPPINVLEHLAFVAIRSGNHRPIYPATIREALEFDLADMGLGHVAFTKHLVTSSDVAALLRLFFDEPSRSDAALLEWMRRSPDRDTLLSAMIEDERFPLQNGAIIKIAARFLALPQEKF
jgi:tetratricopeptide (TPR) repeat protein